jgi:peptide/nickel transport system substrate-binding protein
MMSSETVRPLGELAPENWHRFSDPRADPLLRRLEAGDDPAAEHALHALYAENAPAIPLFPGPLWGEYSSARFTGFPDEDDPYAPLSPNLAPQSLLVLTRLEAVGEGEGQARARSASGFPGQLPPGAGL